MSLEREINDINSSDQDIPNEPYHDEEQDRPSYSDEEQEIENRHNNNNNNLILPIRERVHSDNSYEASLISIQSNPPPYELYPPANTLFGRFYNWLRNMPRINTHQPIYLPTIRHTRSRSIFSLRLHRPSSSSSIASSLSSSDTPFWCFNSFDRLPDRPQIILPSSIARYRLLLIFISSFAFIIFCILLFFSVYFSPIDYPNPTLPDKITYDSARFLTLNIMMRPPLVKNNWSDYKEDRLDYLEKYILPDYDIIAFQAIFAFGSRRKDRLIKAAIEQGFNYHLESPRKYPWDIAIDGGLLIISRFPISQSHILEYPRGQHSDWLSIKGALHAEIELNPNQKIQLYTTHTQGSYDLNNPQDEANLRLSQFAQLYDFICRTSVYRNDSVMIVGDLNLDSAHSSDYTNMMNVLTGTVSEDQPWNLNDLKDVMLDQLGHHPVTLGDYRVGEDGSLIPTDLVLTRWDQFLSAQSLDYLLFSKREGQVRLDSARVEKFWVKENKLLTEDERFEIEFTQISDHYGLSCNIQLN